MAQARARPGWSPPEALEEYRLVRPIGRGGMGQVYLAEDTLLQRHVAVKFIASVRPDAQARQRFQVEARALARLSHPNVVAVHRVGEVEGRPYLVTEFVRGRTLGELSKPLPWEQARHIGLGLARGLAAAHRQGVLHRDIKPANAMLTEEEQLKLLDFGLAQLLEQPESALGPPAPGQPAHLARGLTSEGRLLGTPLYMAPEVMLGAPATRQSDLYSLGAVLYELCTGTAPRQALSAELPLEQWACAEPTPLPQLAPGVEPRFAALIARCLRPTPEQRFASAEELCAALEEVDPEQSQVALPEGNPYRGLRPFEAEHRALFFGRGAEVQAVLERLRTEPLLVVTGDSGVGKSSLCRAGVLPRVAEGALGEEHRYRTLTLIPGRQPLTALASALAGATGLEESHLTLLLRSEPQRLGPELRRVQEPSTALLLFVDQLEELFTQAEPQEAERFGEAVARLAGTPGVRVLLAVRGDFFTRLGSLPVLGEELPGALYLLRPLTREGMRAAIAGPARQRGFHFEPESLVDTLLESAAQAPGGLPLLQFALAELWEAREEARRCLTASALEALGGVAGALARHADGVLATLLPEQRRAARRLLLQLVTAEGTAARRTGAELEAREPTAHAALEALVRSRLLVAREQEGETTYEVSHEALLKGWETLRRWLEADGERRGGRERLEAAAAEWVRLERSREALWSERQLAEARGLEPEELSARGAEFLTTSQRRARYLRYRRWAALVAVPLAVGLALGGLRLKARWDLEAVVAGHEARASTALEEGQRRKAEAQVLRSQAYQRFDAVGGGTLEEATSQREQAEQVWAKVLAASKEADTALVRAGQSFEAALALDPASTHLRGRVGDVLVERIELAEWFHQQERREDLAQRLESYDEGSRRRLLSAPPRLSLTTSPPGAEVVLERYQGEQGRLRPVVVRALGRTPLEQVELAEGPGSYRLTLQAPGLAQVYYPVLLARGESLHLELELPAAESIPQGLAYVPAGRFLYGSAEPEGIRRTMLMAPPLHEVHTGAYLIGRQEVTFREWMDFLEALPEGQRARHLPTALMHGFGVGLERARSGRWQLSLLLNGRRVVAQEGEPLRLPERARRQEQDWSRLPVAGISMEDVQAYLGWLERTGRVPGARPCTEHEWERAARGADGRPYPHGSRLEPEDANFDETYGRKPYAYGPDEVGSHPASLSPFGVLDMTGNVYELVQGMWGREEVLIRGGSWYYDSLSMLTANRIAVERKTRDWGTGLRVCAEAPEHRARE